MSKETAIKFLRELRTNEKAKELLQGRERPKNREEAIKAYAEIAAKLGEDISQEDFAWSLEEIETEIHQRTETVLADMEELEDDELGDVVGGKDNPECVYNVDYSGWCESNDWCVLFDIVYHETTG